MHTLASEHKVGRNSKVQALTCKCYEKIMYVATHAYIITKYIYKHAFLKT